MDDLVAEEAWTGAALEIGLTRLGGVDPGPIAALQLGSLPAGPLADLLAAKFGLALPAPGQSSNAGAASCIWAGHDNWLLVGAAADGLGQVARVSDLTDAWAVADVIGTDAPAVLARLTPLDLAPHAFPPGASARSELRHIATVFLGIEGGIRLFLPRSYRDTALHDLEAAMRSVAVQAELRSS